ncbi:MAG: hypothetical protein G3W67_20740, partial [Xanthomonas perforans]|nr:hypothetical protein [Xanthomonas perforans]
VLIWGMRRWTPLLCVVFLTACVALAGLWLTAENRLRRLQQEVRYRQDASFERRAYAIKAREERSTTREIEDLLFPVTVSFPDRNCVELRPRWGVVGGTSMTCFSNKTGKLLYHASIGE